MEILLKIFGFLDLLDILRNISPVCRRMQNICHNPTLWRNFCFDVYYTKARFDHVFEHAQCFRRLSFVSYLGQLRMEVPPKYIEGALSRCTKLTELNISYNSTIQNLSFLQNMPNLEILIMEYCCNVDAKTAVQALKSLPHPKKVAIAMCEQFTKDQLCDILCSRSSYVHIDIEQCCHIPVKSVQIILHANPSLKCFRFTPSWGPPPKWVELMAGNPEVSFSVDLESMFDRCMYPGWILPEEME